MQNLIKLTMYWEILRKSRDKKKKVKRKKREINYSLLEIGILKLKILSKHSVQ